MRIGALGAVVLLCACFAVAVGDPPARLTVENRTKHIVDFVIAGKSFPTVAPGSEATYESSGGATVTAKASYAAGQGVTGSAQRTFVLVAYRPGSTSGTGVYWACSSSGVVTNPAMGGPVFWAVTPDTLAVR